VAGGRALGKPLEALRAPLDDDVSPRHFFLGGASPVASFQTDLAACRAATAASAASAPERIVQANLPRKLVSVSGDDVAKPESYCNSMAPAVRSLAKPERQKLIASVVSRRRIGSQQELADALAKAGCEVTQATISRDIRELQLEKTTDQLGRPRYVLPGRAPRTDPRKALAGVLGQFGLRATAAQNIVVVQSELGSAPAIARAVDQLEHPKIVGTLAGDDTCLVITRSMRDARAVAGELRAVLG